MLHPRATQRRSSHASCTPLQAAQRKALDAQVKEHESVRRAEVAELAKDKKIVQAEVG